MEPATDAARPAGDDALVRAIGVRSLAANGVNQIVGATIFVLPASVAIALGPAAPAAYLVCGLAISLVMLCIAEAGGRVSATGGIYACAVSVVLYGARLKARRGLAGGPVHAPALVGRLPEG